MRAAALGAVHRKRCGGRPLFLLRLSALVLCGSRLWQPVDVARAFEMPPAEVLADTENGTVDAEDDENPYQSGLVAHYQAAGGREFRARVNHLAFSWGELPPDWRLPPGPFTAVFSGLLQVQSPGEHRLRLFVAGAVQLSINGRELLSSHAATPRWCDAEAIDLPFGYHELRLTYRRADEPARLAVFWEGPGFQLEPLAGHWLHHPRSETPNGNFARGQQLVRGLRCQACHDLPGEPPAIAAPALDSLAGNLSRDWLIDWLSDSPSAPVEHAKGDPGWLARRRMPHFAFSPADAAAVADHLFALSRKHDTADIERPAVAIDPPKKKSKSDANQPPPPEPDAARGQALFRSVGCLACHRAGELGRGGLFGGGDLSHVADKRPADYFERWLDNPRALNRDHRMPVFQLTPLELKSLSLYLQSLRAEQRPAAPPVETSPAERGRQLVEQAGCAACHRLGEDANPLQLARVRLDRPVAANSDATCLAAPDPAGKRPGYALPARERAAIATYLAERSSAASPASMPSGRQLLAERNCLECHAREDSPGLAGELPVIAEADPSLRDLLPALAPPSLASVGDKLLDASLLSAIEVSQPPRQTWLRARMPRFPFAEHEAKQIAAHLIAVDRIPDRPGDRVPETLQPADALDAAGPRLVTADGFGCTSCHTIGKWEPQKVAPNAQGANLSELGQRVRRPWFDRWVRNPARIIPLMEMPSVQQGVRGVLEGHLESQLAAVWRVLDRRGFTPPNPSAMRVVRRSNRAEVKERSAVLTDLIEVEGTRFVKPLIVGLPNRHNVLFDLAHARLAAWWLGDTARQQTRGKSWYLEAGMPQLVEIQKPESRDAWGEIELASGEQASPVAIEGQYATEVDLLEHEGDAVRFDYRLKFASPAPVTLRARQTIRPLPANATAGAGFRRQFRFEGLIDSVQLRLVALAGEVAVDDDARRATLAGKGGRVQVLLADGESSKLQKSPRGATLLLSPTAGVAECQLDYRSSVAADEFAPLPEVDRSVVCESLDVVPGFEAVRLPLTDRAMPTGLAWRPDGTLIASSLEGRVWLGRDSDGDGLVDRLEPFSDDLAAPYGVAATGDAIDVINKYGLLRLTDADGDGRADRMQLLASGWGHTRDYHDWAVGLPRDAEGHYYVSLPCQQDERPAAAALLRGTVVRLVPRNPTTFDPRSYSIDPLCAGLRFPQGIALSAAGELFVTDNQGNYTPFNELNHVRRGMRYGFINRLENKDGFNPPFQPAAVEIPHPWTRSVNGICFLPESAPEKAGPGFGPFAGHLIGCEYDTRRLVRMSLERVEGEFQGAVYPFSSEPVAGFPTFEGPLVCQVSPEGDLYVGNIRDSGWGAGANTGSLVRLRYSGAPAAGIAEVQAVPRGFAIRFTTAVDLAKATKAASYAVSSYRRIPTPDYGGPDRDRRVERIRKVEVSENRMHVVLHFDELREGFVYEFHLRNLTGEVVFFPAEAYYTLRYRAN